MPLTAPTVLNFCNPVPFTQSTSSISATEVLSSSVVDSSTGQTLKCPDNCVACTSAEKCSICRIGYSLNEATGKCVYCNGCLSCNPIEVDVCYLCFAPEVLNRTSLNVFYLNVQLEIVFNAILMESVPNVCSTMDLLTTIAKNAQVLDAEAVQLLLILVMPIHACSVMFIT